MSREITPQEALEILASALAPEYDVTRTPDNEVYVKGPHLIRAIVNISPLPGNRTCLKVRGDWGLLGALPIRLYNGFVGSKRVSRAIHDALN